MACGTGPGQGTSSDGTFPRGSGKGVMSVYRKTRNLSLICWPGRKREWAGGTSGQVIGMAVKRGRNIVEKKGLRLI